MLTFSPSVLRFFLGGQATYRARPGRTEKATALKEGDVGFAMALVEDDKRVLGRPWTNVVAASGWPTDPPPQRRAAPLARRT